MSTTFTPTERQRDVAQQFTVDMQWHDNEQRAEALANLLAEREANIVARAEYAEDLLRACTQALGRPADQPCWPALPNMIRHALRQRAE